MLRWKYLKMSWLSKNPLAVGAKKKPNDLTTLPKHTHSCLWWTGWGKGKVSAERSPMFPSLKVEAWTQREAALLFSCRCEKNESDPQDEKFHTQLKISASLLTACMFARELSVFISPTSAWAVWQRIVTVFFVKHNAETYCLIQGDLTAAVSMIIALYH